MFPLVDLHLHLEGSLSPEIILELAKDQKIKLPEKTAEKLSSFLVAPQEISSMTEFYSKFDLCYKVTQTEKALEKATYLLLKELAEKGIVYSEMRLSPQYHCQKGLYQETVVKACLKGLESAKNDFHINGNLILCCMRDMHNDAENLETLRIAAKYLHRGVCALDLVGPEAMFPTIRYKALFKLASNMDVPFTIHCGVDMDAQNVRDAISFGARRIGHGCCSAMDSDLMEIMSRRNIGIECCVSSNIRTRSAFDVSSHPLWTFLQHGIMCSVNSDLMTICSTDVGKEFKLLEEDSRFSENLRKILLRNAVYTSFMEDVEKQVLLSQINNL